MFQFMQPEACRQSGSGACCRRYFCKPRILTVNPFFFFSVCSPPPNTATTTSPLKVQSGHIIRPGKEIDRKEGEYHCTESPLTPIVAFLGAAHLRASCASRTAPRKNHVGELVSLTPVACFAEKKKFKSGEGMHGLTAGRHVGEHRDGSTCKLPDSSKVRRRSVLLGSLASECRSLFTVYCERVAVQQRAVAGGC